MSKIIHETLLILFNHSGDVSKLNLKLEVYLTARIFKFNARLVKAPFNVVPTGKTQGILFGRNGNS
jgi:hypothetical protein